VEFWRDWREGVWCRLVWGVEMGLMSVLRVDLEFWERGGVWEGGGERFFWVSVEDGAGLGSFGSVDWIDAREFVLESDSDSVGIVFAGPTLSVGC
jgi:hypothetical protein